VALDQALGSVDQGALEPRERCLSRRGYGVREYRRAHPADLQIAERVDAAVFGEWRQVAVSHLVGR